MNRDRIAKRRDKLAGMAERAAVPERPIRGTYIIRPAVSLACARSLQAIAAALRDRALHIDEESLDAARSFFTDGRTALYGYDVTEALRDTIRLQQKIVRPEAVELGNGRPATYERADAVGGVRQGTDVALGGAAVANDGDPVLAGRPNTATSTPSLDAPIDGANGGAPA